jgi:glycosyltransferase involved in cell wall biosynthesis
MNKELKVSIIVPAYNEEENVPLLVEKFAEMLDNSNFPAEVILVDDGSTDETLSLAQRYQEKFPFLKVVSHRINRGITDALVTGFKNSGGEVFVFWPADLQYMPEDIPKLIHKINQGFDIVCGWKEGRYGTKRFVSFVYNTLSRWIFGTKVHDLNSVKAFKKKITEEIPVLRKDWHRYMVVMAKEKGFKIDEVKVKLYPRKYGESKFGFWRIPIGFLDLLSVKFQLSFMKKPMLLFGSFGIILVLIGVVAGVVALYLRIFLDQGYRPLLYLVILCILLGVSFFALGFLAEAIAGLKEEIHWLKGKRNRTKNSIE